MKNKILIFFGISALLLTSCKNEIEKPKVSYDKASKKTVQQKADTTKIQIADLPIQFEGTQYLIYPIGDLNFLTRTSKLSYDSSSSSNEDVSYNVSNNMENEITGFLQNLKFQKINADTLTTLTKKPILLQSVTFLKAFSDKTKQQFLVYSLADSDTNNDGKLDNNDIKSLYLSDISGNRFTKISPDLQEIIDWKTIDSKNSLFFRTIEDTNKNGQFDKNDKVHYNYLNLLEKDWKAIEFMPI
jgi:hypothetical protein